MNCNYSPRPFQKSQGKKNTLHTQTLHTHTHTGPGCYLFIKFFPKAFYFHRLSLIYFLFIYLDSFFFCSDPSWSVKHTKIYMSSMTPGLYMYILYYIFHIYYIFSYYYCYQFTICKKINK